jgi:hypothetical protein
LVFVTYDLGFSAPKVCIFVSNTNTMPDFSFPKSKIYLDFENQMPFYGVKWLD